MHVPEAKLADGFTVATFHGVLPLVIWAAHFFLCYASAEIACALDLQRFALGGVSAPIIWLWTISAAAIAALLVLTVLAVRRGRTDAGSGNTLAAVRIGATVLALVGVLWSAVPIAFIAEPAVCRAMH